MIGVILNILFHHAVPFNLSLLKGRMLMITGRILLVNPAVWLMWMSRESFAGKELKGRSAISV